jgi:Domain of unknown function (DUF4440)
VRLSVSIVVVFAVLSLVMGGCGGSSDTSSSDKTSAKVVRATELRRLHALLHHDLDTAERLHADDFELINPTGDVVSREAYIDSGDAFAYAEWKPISPIRVRVHDDSAVIRYESEIKIHGIRGHFWHTDLYEKRNGQWQIVWSQTTEAA